MMESINQFAQAYAGLLAIGGLLLAVGSSVSAVYFYYNPRQSKYRLSYKIFARGPLASGITRIGHVLKKAEDRTYTSYVDVWNSGGDPISNAVIREPVTINLQSAVSSKGVEIQKVEVLRESHPGISKFETVLDANGVQLTWTHFDPGMAVRIRLETNEPVGGDKIAVFGRGLRLTFKRIRNLSEIGGVASAVQKSFVVIAPIVLAIAIGGPAISWAASQDINGILSYFYFVLLVFVVFLIVIASVALSFGINSVTKWAFNTRSPVEKTEGEPSRRFDSEEERLVLMEHRRAALAFRRSQMTQGSVGEPEREARLGANTIV